MFLESVAKDKVLVILNELIYKILLNIIQNLCYFVKIDKHKYKDIINIIYNMIYKY